MEILKQTKYIRSVVEEVLKEEADLVPEKYISSIFIGEIGKVFRYSLILCYSEEILPTGILPATCMIGDFLEEQDIEVQIRLHRLIDGKMSANGIRIDNDLFSKEFRYSEPFIELRQTNFPPDKKDIMALYDSYIDRAVDSGEYQNLLDKRGNALENGEKSIEMYLTDEHASIYRGMHNVIEKLAEELDNNVIII